MNGPEQDLSAALLQQAFLDGIASGLFWYVHLAVPCSIWSGLARASLTSLERLARSWPRWILRCLLYQWCERAIGLDSTLAWRTRSLRNYGHGNLCQRSAVFLEFLTRFGIVVSMAPSTRSRPGSSLTCPVFLASERDVVEITSTFASEEAGPSSL